MKLLKSLSFVGLLISSAASFADYSVPYTFTNGQSADASQVNANFAALVTAVNSLQAQVTALQAGPTMASLAGTYNIIEMSTEVDSTGAPTSLSMQSTIGLGTVTFNADGTGSINSSHTSSFLNFSQNPITVITDLNAINGSFIDGVYPILGTVQSQQVVTGVTTHASTAVSSVIKATQDTSLCLVSANNNTGSDSGSFTWSLSGNVVTVNAGDTITFSVAGKILVGANMNGSGSPDGISILVHQ